MDPRGSGWATGQAPPPPSAFPFPSTPTASVRANTNAASPNQSEQHRLNHRISSISDLTDFDTLDAYQSAAAFQHQQQQQHPLRGRESLASLASVDSLVFDDSLNAYTRVPASSTSIPASTATTAAPPPTTTAAPASTSQYVGQAQAQEPTHHTRQNAGAVTSFASTVAGAFSSEGYAGGYESLNPPGSGISNQLSNMFSRRKRNPRRGGHDTIAEEPFSYSDARESIDLTSLVQDAAPMGRSTNDAGHGDVPVDLTGYLGPTTKHDEAFLKKLQEQEASGQLTLGLGAGFGPGTQLKESELLANATSAYGAGVTTSSPTVFRPDRAGSLRRTLSRRWPSSATSVSSAWSPLTPTSAQSVSVSPVSAHALSRQGTVRALAQSEANRRGEIVEVIMEEEDEDGKGEEDEWGDDFGSPHGGHGTASKVDLSVVSGPSGPDPLAAGINKRPSTIPLRAVNANGTPKTEVFYPQPNWRPFSMRWPYLVSLILLSLGLAVGQELLYRMSVRRPLITFSTPSQIPAGLYFAIQFAPTLIAVTFGVLCAVADESINVDYVTYFTFFRPFRALYCKHYAVAISSVASLLAVSLVPTLSAAAIVLTPDRAARLADPHGEKHVIIGGVWSRVLTATLCVIAALGCVLFWLLQRRRSGLLSDVKGIAGLASMAVVSHILTDFKDMDVATHKDIHHKLKDHRYVLRNSSLAPDTETAVSLQERERYKEFDRHLSQNPHPLMLRARGCVPYIAGIVAFGALIPAVLFTPANVLVDKAAWLLTALAVAIKLGWGGLETAVRMMEPYYLLSRRHAPAKTLTLDYTAVPFLLLPLRALANGHLLVVFVGFGTIMTELLTVLVTSLATVEGHDFIGGGGGGDANNSSHTNATMTTKTRTRIRTSSSSSSSSSLSSSDSGVETAMSFWVTLGLAMFILAYMSIVAAVVFVRRRRPFLPRQPNTIASVLAFIHQSKMLWDFVGTSKMNNAAMLARLEALGRTYGLGWFEGRDGQTHCGVDHEELMSSYKLGYDYSRSNQPWNDRPVEWL
ncbi:hypothetical protein SPI_08893 [Niveomyces insectorum RCEF 264]|uniref:DUF3433 domain containing protein n=1 Tax=Niveomyces insectorum RCEF 264 TaxID=1081102 RepID=A0A167MF32_9HYPO|nr:hypothetical protein SPI_08893 [Niveomyces insectorum RCEF 264]